MVHKELYQRTQVKFHLGVRDLATGFLRAKPLIRSEMIGSAVQSADLEKKKFSVFEMAER